MPILLLVWLLIPRNLSEPLKEVAEEEEEEEEEAVVKAMEVIVQTVKIP
jgi:hypothetical protein